MSVRKRKWTTANGEPREAWIVDYTDGKGDRHLKTFDRKKDADAYHATVRVEVREGTHIADSETVTVKEAGGKWLESGKADGLERTTRDQRRQHLTFHIEPFLGKLRLSKLSVPVVRAFQDRLRAEPYPDDYPVVRLRGKSRSGDMIKRVTVSLGSIIADAQERGLVARNAIRDMTSRRTKGKVRKGERRQKARLQYGVDIPTRDEVRLIIENTQGRYRPLLITAIFTGLRASELRGLRWSDVDLADARLHVRQRADKYHAEKYRVDHDPIGMPKSDAGQRSVPLSPLVVNTLREWKLSCPKGKLDLVFPNSKGNIEYHANIIKRGLWPAEIAAGVVVPTGEKDKDGAPIMRAKYTGLHALRHFYASWCINRRADGGLELPGKMVQERLGHSSITMTMDVYGHLFPSTDDSDALAQAERSLLTPVSKTADAT
ncbi:site-specific integrase [Mesorhizobium sp. YR577]|uniref:tyrosine-type recombinase/integrase n=1 Tax=Mesorhizobium sp. YR577 TaxID=1884373 RepID=UPI0008F07710|nr:site-specific integrase [Mesorhizobium sp. YR577]SFT71529.1 Site-specific recombinase XerD [Mesorhizobium sp. YR577]